MDYGTLKRRAPKRDSNLENDPNKCMCFEDSTTSRVKADRGSKD